MAQFRLAVEMNPEFGFARSELGTYLIDMNRIDEGTAEIEKALKLSPDNVWAKPRLALAYGMAGRKAEAESILREAKEASSHTYVPGTVLAMIYTVLGRRI
jgi:Flp pilus assembly protein TadD